MCNATSIDLFCGAGGLAASLERAGWETVSAVDADRHAIGTMSSIQSRKESIDGSASRTYFRNTNLILRDIASVSANDLKPSGVKSSWRPTLLAGGPPCQPFSSAGKQRGMLDPRGVLFRHFVRLADELRPHFILFENVRGLVTAKCPDGEPGAVLKLIQTEFEEIGYACQFDVLNAADFGAPQRRSRLVMLASADFELPNFPESTHAIHDEAKFLGLHPWVSLGKALKSLPYPNAVDVVLPKPDKLAELSALVPGTGIKASGIVEANRPGGHWGYRQDSFLADLSLPSRTIRAATTPDWIRDQRGVLRRLTWQECAMLQGFASSWQFSGNTANIFRQIGNAVNGHVGEAIGRHLLSHAAVAKRAAPSSPEWPQHFIRCVTYTRKEHEVNGASRKRAGSVP